jgi:hypothetical protein
MSITTCDACNDRGWLLAFNDEYGTRIERCDSCKRFLTDAEAVTYVHVLASEDHDETDAVIVSGRERNNDSRLHAYLVTVEVCIRSEEPVDAVLAVELALNRHGITPGNATAYGIRAPERRQSAGDGTA